MWRSLIRIMEKEEISLIAQLLSSMNDAVDKLENAQKKNDMEMLASAKREIISFQKNIDKLL